MGAGFIAQGVECEKWPRVERQYLCSCQLGAQGLRRWERRHLSPPHAPIPSPLRHREDCGAKPLPRQASLRPHELRPGEQRLLRLRGLVSMAVAVVVAVSLDSLRSIIPALQSIPDARPSDPLSAIVSQTFPSRPPPQNRVAHNVLQGLLFDVPSVHNGMLIIASGVRCLNTAKPGTRTRPKTTLTDQQLLHSLSRTPFIDSAELALILGEAHATIHSRGFEPHWVS